MFLSYLELKSVNLACSFNGPIRAKFLDGKLIVFGNFSQVTLGENGSRILAKNIAWLDCDQVWQTARQPIGLKSVHDILQTREGLILLGHEGLELISTVKLDSLCTTDGLPTIRKEEGRTKNLAHSSSKGGISSSKNNFGALIQSNSLSLLGEAGQVDFRSQKYRASSICVHDKQVVVSFVERLECAYKLNDPLDLILDKTGLLNLSRDHEYCQSVVLVWNAEKQNYQVLGKPLLLDVKRILSFKGVLYALTSKEMYRFVDDEWEIVRIKIYGQSTRFNNLRVFNDKLYICGHHIPWPGKNWTTWCGVYEYDPVSGSEKPLRIVGDVRDILFANNSELVMGSDFDSIGDKEHFKGVFVLKYQGGKHIDHGVFPNPKNGAGMSLEYVQDGENHFALVTLSRKSEHLGAGNIDVTESIVSCFRI